MASPEYEQLRKVLKPGLAIPSDPPETRAREDAPDPSDEVPRRRDGGAHDARRRATRRGSTRPRAPDPRASRCTCTAARSSRPASSTTSRTPRGSRGRSPRASAVYGYRLAPEHRYPAALDDTHAVYRALLEAGTPPDRIVVSGDSCGGGIGIALLLRLRDGRAAVARGVRRPHRLVRPRDERRLGAPPARRRSLRRPRVDPRARARLRRSAAATCATR